MRYRNAKHLGVRARQPRSGCILSSRPRRNKFRLFRFFYKKISHTLHCSSFLTKSHAWLVCSVVNAFTKIRCRYHLFVSFNNSSGCIFYALNKKDLNLSNQAVCPERYKNDFDHIFYLQLWGNVLFFG